MKNALRIAAIIACVICAVRSNGIFDYGSVEFGWLKSYAVIGWLVAAGAFAMGMRRARGES